MRASCWLALALLLPAACGQRLAISIQTYSKNHHLIEVGRETWRRGIPTVIITNGTTERQIDSPSDTEVWFEAPDIPTLGWNNPSEQRYVSQVRFANATFDFDWLLSGDDDTLFLIDNVLEFVRGLDPQEIYYISDATEDDPYGCTLPEEASERGPEDCVANPPAVPCLRSVMEDPKVCRSSQVQRDMPNGLVERPGGTVFASGAFGSLASRGLIDSVTLEDWQHCEFCNGTGPGGEHVDESKPLSSRTQYQFTCYGGGDVRIGECFWAFGANRRGVAPTVPYSRHKDAKLAHEGMIPPRVFGGGAELGGRGDYPNGPHGDWGIIDWAQAVVDGRPCDHQCRWILERSLSTSVPKMNATATAHRLRHFSATYGKAKRMLHGSHGAGLRARVDAHRGAATPLTAAAAGTAEKV